MIHNFIRRAAHVTTPRHIMVSSRKSSVPTFLYTNLWRKSNINYITYVVVGCVLAEIVYGSATDALWSAVNRGVRLCIPTCLFLMRLSQKLYNQIDWSKFKTEDDDDE